MTDAIRQLAEERRRRYQSLSEAEKPRVVVCADCHEPTYKREVCPRTGLFHDLDKKRLVGGSVVEGNVITSSELMGAIDRTRVKWVASRTQLVKADAQSLNIFQSFVAQMDWNLQRYGILYGRYDEVEKTIEVHTVYEPEQHGTRYTFEPLEDKRIAVVDGIAAGLGLRRVGIICTHPPRDPDTCLLSSREMLLCAREQSRFGDECVLLTVAPRCVSAREEEEQQQLQGAMGPTGSPTSTVSGATGQQQVECQAWQTSPQCVYLYRLGVLHEPDTPTAAAATGGAEEGGEKKGASSGSGTASAGVKALGQGNASGRVGQPTTMVTTAAAASASPSSLSALQQQEQQQEPDFQPLRDPEEARYVASTLALEVTQQDADPSGRQRFVTKAPSKRVDTRWFTSYIAVQQFESDVVRGLFMRISRPGMAPPTFQNLRNYFTDPKRKNDTFASKLADFHVLIFLSEVFSAADDLPALVEVARSRQMTEVAKNYEAILQDYLQ